MRWRPLALAGALAALPLLSAAQHADHAQMDHAPAAPADRAPAMQAPVTPLPAITEADRLAAIPPSTHHVVGDQAIHSYTLLNRVEIWDADAGMGLGWEAQGWVGQDVGRVWWRTEGERVDGATEAADVEVLYGRAFARWWEWVAGVRHDLRPGPAQTFAAFGIQGLAPQWFEVALTGYVGEGGQTALRIESEYELFLTNRLVLQPLLEIDLSGKSDPARGTGAGVVGAEAGLRLRYEIERRFAPYVGVVFERAYGRTADLYRARGDDVDELRLVAGVRIWF